MKKRYLISLGFLGLLTSTLSLIIFGGYIYFVSQFSAVFPPIKEYQIEVSAPQLRSDIIRCFENQDKIYYKFTDTVGSKNNLAYYMNIRIRDHQFDNYYTFKYYEKKKRFSNSFKSNIALISAYDSLSRTGGYKLKDVGMEKLISIFEQEFIEKLKTDKNKK